MKNTKKVKSFRISEISRYKLSKLKEAWRTSEGKVLEKLINAAYYEICSNMTTYREDLITEDLVKIANTEWIKDH